MGVFAIEPGFWETDVAVICKREDYERTKAHVGNLCKYAFRGLTFDPRSNEIFPVMDLPPEKEKTRTILILDSTHVFSINYRIFETDNLFDPAKSEEVKDYIAHCAQVMYFYDVLKESIEEMNKTLKFLISFPWNNCIEFLNFYDSDEINYFYNEDDSFRLKFESVKYNLNEIEHGGPEEDKELYAYKGIWSGKNNRWGRLHCSDIETEIYSNFQALTYYACGPFKAVDFVKCQKLEEGDLPLSKESLKAASRAQKLEYCRDKEAYSRQKNLPPLTKKPKQMENYYNPEAENDVNVLKRCSKTNKKAKKLFCFFH